MAKLKATKQQAGPVKKQSAPSGDGTFTYLWHSAVIVAVIAITGWLVWHKFDKDSQLNELTQEFYKERAYNPNSPRLRELYDQIMALQPEVIADTGLFARSTRGYHWAIHDMALGSLEDIKDREEKLHQLRADSTEKALFEAKMMMKVGLYPFIKEIIRSTPDTAVILLPEGDSAVSNNGKWNFIYDPEWMEYFLYPRLCVSIGTENIRPELARRASYVVIVEGKGYDKLKYDVPVEMRPREAVLPIYHPPVQQQVQTPPTQ